MWPDNRICELFGIELPIVQAPMAGSQGSELAIAVSEAGESTMALDEKTLKRLAAYDPR